MNYSNRFNKDWEFFLKNQKCFSYDFDYSDKRLPTIIADSSGRSAKECYLSYESFGKLPICAEAELLKKAFLFKRAVNFHIQMWAQGYADCLLGIENYLSEFTAAPKWIGNSLRNAIHAVVR